MRAWTALGLVVVTVGGFWRARVAHSQAMATPAGQHVALAPSDIKWTDPPPVLRKGAKMAVVYGEPDKAGSPYVIFLRVPAGYRIMPHWHPTDENVTVLHGSMAAGIGDTFDPNVKPLPAGSFFSMPAGMHHFAVMTTESLIQVTGLGPFKLVYVHPEDDPSKQRATR